MSLSVFLHPRKLHNRIAGVYLLLLLVVLVLLCGWLHLHLARQERVEVSSELATTEKVLRRLVDQQSSRLHLATQVLANAPDFRAAVAQASRLQVNAALQRHSHSGGADMALFIDTDFTVLAHTPGDAHSLVPALRRQVALAEGQAGAPSIENVNGQAVRMVAVPVHAPGLIGWVSMATHVDEAALLDLRSLLGLDLVVLLPQAEGRAQIAQATLPRAQWAALQSAWHEGATSSSTHRTLSLGDQTYSRREVVWGAAPGQAGVTVGLLEPQAPTLPRSATVPVTLLGLCALSFAIFGLGTLYTMRHITAPLQQLTQSVRRLEQGDYTEVVQSADRHEIGVLAQSFEAMRLAIRHRETEIRRLAYEDTLTSLPNREQFRQTLREALQQARAHDGSCSVLMLDMDRFKQVNDVLGHRFGDRLLQAVAARLRAQVQPTPLAVLARLSGDEFAILLPGVMADTAFAVAQRILRSFETSLTLNEHTVDLSAGIGIACSPEHGDDPDLLLNRAEIAMYVAKQQQAGALLYHPGLDSSSEESLTLLSELRVAVDSHQLRLFLQPKIDLRTNEVIGAEALVRWAHPTRGMVPPARFIPFAEQTGFIRAITMWVIAQVARTAAQLERQGLPLKIAVNLSTRDLLDPDLPNKIEELIARDHLTPDRLMLEITESAIMDDPQRALHTLERLHGLGVKLSIDDFGTGYSSLAYLKRLPVDELKIDQSFVKHMESDLDDAKIVRSTIDLAHNLGLRVVAEGVETAKAWKLLAGLACDEAQGYFIAKPMPAEDFAAWLLQWQAPHTQDEYLASEFSAMLI